eukprot:GHRQ01009302.1.p1 GENE.GHRQ01009302.1~~GHRQ01009302.1.p1  ORF type:complete len:430 (+),score=49.17 GHRQ01009302.1:429-1718(+)
MRLYTGTVLALLLAVSRHADAAGRRSTLTADMVVEPRLPPNTLPGVDDTTNNGPVQPNDPDNSTLPEQVHLTYWKSPAQMLVSFVTGAPITSLEPVTKADLPVKKNGGIGGIVRYGTSANKLSTPTRGRAYAYIQNNNYNASAPQGASPWRNGYVSGVIHHVLLKGLQPATTYFYQFAGSPKGPWSDVYNFTTLSIKPTFPFRIGYMGDLGNSLNASLTVDRMVASKPQIVGNLGDISYADVYNPNGTYGGYKTYKSLKYHLSYQPAWDQNARMLEKLASHVPVMTLPGNHELEFQPDSTVFASYNTRYPMPQSNGFPRVQALQVPANGGPVADPVNMFYSVDIPGVAHMVFISNYIPNDTWGTNTRQYKWLQADLKRVDRKVSTQDWPSAFAPAEYSHYACTHVLASGGTWGYDVSYNQVKPALRTCR